MQKAALSFSTLLVFTVTAAFFTVRAGAKPLVAGYEREGSGDLLLGELGCAHCHQGLSAGASGAALATRPAPRLTAAGDRIRPEFLRRFLAAPHAIHPGTTMPDVLRVLPPARRKEAVRALVDFLGARGEGGSGEGKPGAAADTRRPLPPGSAARGRRLYHRTGCVACHEPGDGYRPESIDEAVDLPARRVPSVPLGPARGRKYRPGALARFLLNPLATRPGGRMPRVPLEVQEAADIAAYLESASGQEPPPAGRTRAAATAATTERRRAGERWFVSLGCAACHEPEHPRRSEYRAPAIHILPPGRSSRLPGSSTAPLARGCLAEPPSKRAPDFRLDDAQRSTLKRTLARRLRDEAAAAIKPAQALRHRILAFNCIACHERDGLGGPGEGRVPFFESTEQADLGFEGRLPPPLTGAGAKLKPAALREIVSGRGAIRPYIATRMPDFGPAHARSLAKLFETVDRPRQVKPFERVGRNMYGRKLVGMNGLQCIVCHGFAGHRSLGIPALDLVTVPGRVRAEWFRRYMVDPSRFRPGTRMPSFWPGGKAANRKILGGDVNAQIDGIWVYLLEADQTRLPAGLEREDAFELKPAGRPLVFRTFMEHAGLHAIAVGYPAGVHAAFDADQVAWALAWRGRFLDAEGTWEDRFAPLARPLGGDILHLAGGVPFAAGSGRKPPPWPATGRAARAGYRFRGYRLDAAGVPSILYELGATRCEDRVTPYPERTGKEPGDTEPNGKEPGDTERTGKERSGTGLRRRVTLRGRRDGLWHRLAAGQKIVPVEPGVWRVDERFVVELETDVTRARVRTRGDRAELLLPVRFERNSASIEVLWRW